MKTIPPVYLRESFYSTVWDEIAESFVQNVFYEVINLLRRETAQAEVLSTVAFLNAKGAAESWIVRALRNGEIQYKDGRFFGKFNARTSGALRDLGAKLDLRNGEFYLDPEDVPAVIKGEAANADRKAQQVYGAIEAQLLKQKNLLEAGQMYAPINPAAPIDAIEESFETAASTLGITRRINPEARARMEEKYATEIRPYVVEATAKYIDEVNVLVRRNAAAGFRYDSLVEELESKIGVTHRKAKFLARQETALFMAAYREERFTAAGVTRYYWQTSKDSRVRCGHAALQGQIFFYATKAPAEYMSSKRPCNPGEDFGCRCVDRAIVDNWQ